MIVLALLLALGVIALACWLFALQLDTWRAQRAHRRERAARRRSVGGNYYVDRYGRIEPVGRG